MEGGFREKILSLDLSLTQKVFSINSRCRRLNLSSNLITCERIDEAALSRFSSMLVYLNLSSNRLEGELPRSFCVLENLHSLDLSRNDIIDIKALAGIKSLKRLDVAFNKIARWEQLETLSEGGIDLLSLRLEENPVCFTITAGEKGKEQYTLLIKSLFPNIERIDDPESVGGYQRNGNGNGNSNTGTSGERRGSDSGISIASSSARTVNPSPPSPLFLDNSETAHSFQSEGVTRASSSSSSASLTAARAALSAAASTRSAAASRATTPSFETIFDTNSKSTINTNCNVDMNGHNTIDMSKDKTLLHCKDIDKHGGNEEEDINNDEQDDHDDDEEEEEEEDEEEEEEEEEEDEAESEEEDDNNNDKKEEKDKEEVNLLDHFSKPPLPPPFVRTHVREKDESLVASTHDLSQILQVSTTVPASLGIANVSPILSVAPVDLQIQPSTLHSIPIPSLLSGPYSHPSSSSHLATPARPPSLSALQSSSSSSSSSSFSSSLAPLPPSLPPVSLSSLGSPQSTPGRGTSVFETKISFTNVNTPAEIFQKNTKLDQDVFSASVAELAHVPSSKLLSMLKSAEQRLAAQDEILAEYEATLSTAFQLQQQQHDSAARSITASRDEREDVNTIEDDLDDVSVQAMAYTRTLSTLRRDLVASRHAETNGHREISESRARERTLQLQFDAIKEELDSVRKEIILKDQKTAVSLERQEQQVRENEERLREQYRDNENRMREQINLLQQRSQQQYATYQHTMRKAELASEESRNEILKEMEDLRTRQVIELKEHQRRCASLIADADARAALVGRTLSASLSDASMLRTELLEAQTRLTSETIKRETAEAALADTKAALSSAYQSESFGRQQARKALEGKSLLGGLSQEVAKTLTHCSNQADALERTVRDALTQLSARTAVAAGMIQGLKLCRLADSTIINSLIDGINEERHMWTEALSKQSERWQATNAAKKNYKSALAKFKAYKTVSNQQFGVNKKTVAEEIDKEVEDEEEEEEEEEEDKTVVDSSLFSTSTSLAALEIHVREKKRLLTLLSTEHEEEIQAEAKLLASTCTYTDFCIDQLLMNSATGKGEVNNHSSLSSSATIVDPSFTSLLSNELVSAQLVAAQKELSILRPRLDAILTLLEKGEGVEKSHATALSVKLEHTERHLAQQRIEFDEAIELAAKELKNEKEASALALEKAEAARVRQVSAARDASLRSRSQSSNLEARLQTTLDELKIVKDECKRLEKEATLAIERSAQEQKIQIDAFSDRLAIATRESEEGKRAKEEVDVLRKERDILLAALTKK
jgi:hypothetical protein